MAEKTTFTTEQKRAASIACQQWGQLHVYPQKPKAIDAPAERSTLEREPEGMSVTERKLYDVNPRDHEWRKQFFNDLPEYLVKYFATRYISICEKKSFKDANIFLRERMRPASDRVRMVLANYKKLPTTQKVALLSEEHNDTEQSNFTRPNTPVAEQARFDFDQAEKNRKPVKSRILAELEFDELKEMAFKLSSIIISYQATLTSTIECETEEGENLAALMVYRQCAELIDQFGIKAPGAGKKLTDENVFQFISKMRCDKWWNNRLVEVRKVMREHLAIAMGQVSSKASPYASWDCIREHQEQQKRNWEAIQNMSLFDEETGEEADLAGMVLKSVSNPAIRRHELMVRCRGCEDIATSLGLQGLFLTLTTPAQYHNSYKKGGFIGHWNGASPRDAQGYLNNVWQRIRAKLSRDGIRCFGVRVAEPHHDGTPHWHLLLWVKPEEVLRVTDIFIRYAVKADMHELMPTKQWPLVDSCVRENKSVNPFKVYSKVYANNFPVKVKRHCPEVVIPDSAQRLPIVEKTLTTLNVNYSARCDVGFIDPEQGTATGYIAKYISKNIDGFAMDDEVSDETGKSVKDMAKNVSAWKSRWCIRQFQFFGGAPVTTYRELRRFANQNKKAFMEYVFMQERGDLMAIYGMLNRHIVGPVKPARALTNGELVEFIAANYESRIKTHSPSIAGTLKAADHGNWQGYIMGQGGPFVKRNDLLIVNVYQELPFASPHGETVRKLQGFQTPEEVVKTRLKVWTIKKKTPVNEEAEAGALALASDLALSGASGSSRSSVNNCTELDEVQVCDQLTRLLSPNEIVANSPPNMGAFSVSALLKGSSVRIDNETSIQIRPAEVDEHGNKRPAQLIEVSRVPTDDMNWLNFEGWDKTFAQPEQVKEEYQQPDLSFFPDAECDWPLA
ncbi:replication endonuclease [Vibrio crassostreae]|uniref:replication endonuclease n=1 Tax=Vibrio crassostreae TaxID=246167 RepID=UPI0010518A3A|nr:replication endonuclease [Vibrio crassostreae]TCT61904.1 bacteriophage replication gene A protein [Vibrio crassostreae]